jgi:acyl homoserine lactone synthase
MEIIVGQRSAGTLAREDELAMHRLRCRVFRQRLARAVDACDAMERDRCDALDSVYVIVMDAAGDVCGCWRMLPTTGPNMPGDAFAQSLGGEPASRAAAVWELSRFAVEIRGADAPAFPRPFDRPGRSAARLAVRARSHRGRRPLSRGGMNLPRFQPDCKGELR